MLSDAGSTPAASISLAICSVFVGGVGSQVGIGLRPRLTWSTPAASTNLFLRNQAVTAPVPAASRLSPTLEVCPESNRLITYDVTDPTPRG